MQPSPKLIALGLSSFLFYSGVLAQNTYKPERTGYVNFSLESSTLPHTKSHPIALYGCNTSLTVDSKFWNGPDCFKWNTDNQVLSGVPFGQQIDATTKDTFFVSKYYIASPPVFKTAANGILDSNTLYDIGLVTPDAFVLNGEKPVQMVYLEYSILKPMHIKYIPVTFDSSFDSLGVNLLPFKVECDDFPWLDSNGVVGAKGASGIGALNRDSTNTGRLFLPYYYVKKPQKEAAIDSIKNHLDCDVTILNDILYHHEIFFVVHGEKQTSVNLKDYYTKNPRGNISLHCEYRKDLPCGCIEPRPQHAYKK